MLPATESSRSSPAVGTLHTGELSFSSVIVNVTSHVEDRGDPELSVTVIVSV